MKNKITIQTALNGYIVTHHYFDEVDEDGKEKYKDEVEIFESKDEENNNDALVKTLYFVAELLGIQHDKYSSNNLNIAFDKKGRKVDG